MKISYERFAKTPSGKIIVCDQTMNNFIDKTAIYVL